MVTKIRSQDTPIWQGMSHNYAEKTYLIQALQWHIDHGADEVISDSPIDKTVIPEIPKRSTEKAPKPVATGFQDNKQQAEMMGAAQAVVESRKLAASCDSVEALAEAIRGFDGLSVKKTATNMVFCDGNPEASVMLIGEAPGGDEDIQGKPFVGVSGQLLDRILACIDLARAGDDPQKSVYISNILNWRPPGNRTPTSAEIDISLPFIERHIALVQPKLLILCGGVSAKALLRRTDSISKLRGAFHDYQVPEDLQVGSVAAIPAMATYHPAYLLRTPAQKKAVWADMLMFQEKLQEILS